MANSTFQISKCEVCQNTELKDVLNLGLHPMCDDLVPIGDERVCKEYPIEILYCGNCNTAHQKYQIDKTELFPSTYHYRSRFTKDVLEGMKDFVAKVKSTFGDLSGKLVVDVGCNDGSLLDFFRENGARTIGVEPTGAFSDAVAKQHVVYNDFFDLETAAKIKSQHGSPDFICFTNVFAHIEDLGALIEALKSMGTEKTNIIIENHYLGAVLANNQFDTFYHEHPRTYSAKSFTFIAKSLGKEIVNVEFPSRYAGNIRVFMSALKLEGFQTQEKIIREIDKKEGSFGIQFQEMSQKLGSWQTNTKALIQKLVKENGKLKAKAFPGRAAILVKLLDLSEKEISMVFEKPGSMKINNYLPGTRIPIGSDTDLFKGSKDEPILNLAWHISKEIREYLKANNYSGQVIDILSTDLFE